MPRPPPQVGKTTNDKKSYKVVKIQNIDIQNIPRVKKDRPLRWATPLLILAEVPVRAQPGLRGEDLQRIPTINKHRFSQFFLLPIDSHHTSHEMLKLTTGSGLNQKIFSNILVLLIALELASAIAKAIHSSKLLCHIENSLDKNYLY